MATVRYQRVERNRFIEVEEGSARERIISKSRQWRKVSKGANPEANAETDTNGSDTASNGKGDSNGGDDVQETTSTEEQDNVPATPELEKKPLD